jgi:cellulose synthase/poly-beta-1,6-N-acetylglucosamine synthase-like glycosyltransferase
MSSDPRYSVIVPAYNAAGTIERCLQALLHQSVPAASYEVLVVDDGSTDDTARLVSRWPVRLLLQPHAGPASSRNYGARAASGRYLLFTDADCAPIPTWIEQISRPLETDPKVAGVKGVYRSCQRGLIARFVQLEFEAKYAHLRRQRSIDFVDTGSAAFRAEAFWALGGFEPQFLAPSNEDTQLSFGLVSRGWRLVFADQAAVYHEHADSPAAYLRRKWRHGYWRVRVYHRHPTKMLGDSYTPRSMQLQFLGALATLCGGLLPRARALVGLGAASFLLGTLPFVRQALPRGWGLAAATPALLFLRALALAGGLTQGAVTVLIVDRLVRRDGTSARSSGA